VKPPWSKIGPAAAVALCGLALAFVLPSVVEVFVLVDLTAYIVMAILALSLALVWGYAGILCFGQSAFFGIGGYAYVLGVMNLGESTIPIAIGIALPMIFAAVLGYFLFYGRVGDIYLGVITLCVSLILFNLVNSMSGTEYKIGSVPIGGHNGIPGVPPINLPGNPTIQLSYEGTFQLSLIVLVFVYVSLQLLLASKFGRVVISIRLNELRTELLGYDARLYKLIVFIIGAGIAGIAGILFANWGSFIGPTVFSILFSAQIIIWIMVGGLGTLAGAVAGALAIQWLATSLGTSKIADPNIVLGAIFIVFVLLVPRGIQPTLLNWLRPFVTRTSDSKAEA
jgi:ABC-type branched-subunit amino acid transport system permease subunit